MSHILHLGHQARDIFGVLPSTTTGFFDSALDVNGLHFARFPGAYPFSLRPFREPTNDTIWLGFRFRAANSTSNLGANPRVCTFRDATDAPIAALTPFAPDRQYRAQVFGDTTEDGVSSFIPTSAQVVWLDIRLRVAADIEMDLYADGVLVSSASATNGVGRGRPRRITFENQRLFSFSSTIQWGYAHFAVLDGVSTINRRFVRRRPQTQGALAEMSGTIPSLADGLPTSGLVASGPNQRHSFTNTGPAIPAGTIGGVHMGVTAQGLAPGVTQTRSFLRIGGVNFDGTPEALSPDAPVNLLSSWALNPATGLPWDAADAAALELGVQSLAWQLPDPPPPIEVSPQWDILPAGDDPYGPAAMQTDGGDPPDIDDPVTLAPNEVS